MNPFPERVRELKTWISEDAGPEARVEGLLTVAPYFRIKLARAKEILRQVEDAVARWRADGAALGMTADELDAFEALLEASDDKLWTWILGSGEPDPEFAGPMLDSVIAFGREELA